MLSLCAGRAHQCAFCEMLQFKCTRIHVRSDRVAVCRAFCPVPFVFASLPNARRSGFRCPAIGARFALFLVSVLSSRFISHRSRCAQSHGHKSHKRVACRWQAGLGAESVYLLHHAYPTNQCIRPCKCADFVVFLRVVAVVVAVVVVPLLLMQFNLL